MVTGQQVAERLYAAFTAGDTDGVLALLDPAIQWELVGPEAIPYFGRYEGIDAVRRFFEVLAATITVEAFAVHRVTPSAAGAIAEGFERGSFSRNGAGYEMRWCHVMTVRDGRVVELTDYLDTAPMLEAWNV